MNIKEQNQKTKYLFLLIPILLIFACDKHKETQQKTKVKPNIIYILADDLGYGDLNFTGQSKFNTPNIDKLAKEGMFFSNHYAGSNVCGPSRSTLMTGRHTGHTFIRGNKEIGLEGQYPLDSSVVTIAEVLKSAGYVTGAFGKWGLGFQGSAGDPNNQGFDSFYGYNCQRQGHHYYPYYLWDNQKKELLSGNREKIIEVYAPEIIHQKVISFIEKCKDTTFFMFYPSIIPHAELKAPEEFTVKYRNKLLPEKRFEGVDDGEEYKNGGYGSQNEAHATFATMVDLLDTQVGEIREKVEELVIAKNTIIIFTSDNGPHTEGGADPDYFDSNGKYRGYKRDLYEGGIRVPMIVNWPEKVKENSISNHLSAFWGFMPTICDIVGIDCPENTDGISYLPELLGKKEEQHNYLYWEFVERGGKQAVRIGDWKCIRLNMKNELKAPIEVYNLVTDIGETNNAALQNPEIVEKISEIMIKEHTFSEDFSFDFEKKIV